MELFNSNNLFPFLSRRDVLTFKKLQGILMQSFVNFSESPFAQLFNKRCPYWRYFANLKDLYIVDCPIKHNTTEASYTTTLLLWLLLFFFWRTKVTIFT